MFLNAACLLTGVVVSAIITSLFGDPFIRAGNRRLREHIKSKNELIESLERENRQLSALCLRYQYTRK